MPLPSLIPAAMRSLAQCASTFGVAVLFAGSIHLVERRGKKNRLDP